MAKDSEALEGTQDAQSQSSDDKAGQQSSKQDYITIEQFNELSRKLDLIARTAQGDKDRAVKRANQRLDEVEGSLREVLQIAKKDGRSIDDLLAEAEQSEERQFRQTVSEIAQAFKSGKIPGVALQGSEGTSGVNMSEVLSELELDLNDTRVKNFATQKFSSKEAALVSGAKLIKIISTSKPSDADIPGNASERVRAAGKQEQLMAEYREGSKNLRGKALMDYKYEMRKKGLEIS